MNYKKTTLYIIIKTTLYIIILLFISLGLFVTFSSKNAFTAGAWATPPTRSVVYGTPITHTPGAHKTATGAREPVENGVNTYIGYVTNQNHKNQIERLRPAYIRLGIGWATIEPSLWGQYDWSSIDSGMDVLEEYASASPTGWNAKIIVSFTIAPAWAREAGSTNCGRIASNHWNRYAIAIWQLYNQYSFIDSIEIWNEPDSDDYDTPYGYGCWGSSATPYYGGRYYGDFLKYTYLQLDDLYNGNIPFNVIFGGLMMAGDPISGRDMTDYFDGALNQMAQNTPDVACNYFDAVSFHHYTSSNQYENYNPRYLPATQVFVLQNAMATRCPNNPKPLWWTELGLQYSSVQMPIDMPAYATDMAHTGTPWSIPTLHARFTQVAWEQVQYVKDAQDYVWNTNPNPISVWLWFMLWDDGWKHVGMVDTFDWRPTPTLLPSQVATYTPYATTTQAPKPLFWQWIFLP